MLACQIDRFYLCKSVNLACFFIVMALVWDLLISRAEEKKYE